MLNREKCNLRTLREKKMKKKKNYFFSVVR